VGPIKGRKIWSVKVWLGILCALWALTWSVPGAIAADLDLGAKVFEVHCVGCHLKGGNIVRRGKTLQLRALQRNGVDTQEAIADLVTHGKNNMSAYGDRLTPEEIQAVSAYVLDRAQTGWR